MVVHRLVMVAVRVSFFKNYKEVLEEEEDPHARGIKA
jgi:hypothetical protein